MLLSSQTCIKCYVEQNKCPEATTSETDVGGNVKILMSEWKLKIVFKLLNVTIVFSVISLLCSAMERSVIL